MQLDALERAPHNDDTSAYLSDTVLRSEGLPAVTFDVLTRLAKHPRLLVRMLLRAADPERQRLLQLERELEFCWLSIPLSVWASEALTYRSAIQEVVSDKRTATTTANSGISHAMDRAVAQWDGLAVAREWVAVTLGMEPPTKLLFVAAHKDGPPSIAQKIRDEHQRVLHSWSHQSGWPTGPMRDDWLHVLSNALTRVPSERRKALWMDTSQVGFRRPLLDAPIGMALCCALSVPITPRLERGAKALRALDPAWFNTAYKLMLALLVKSVS